MPSDLNKKEIQEVDGCYIEREMVVNPVTVTAVGFWFESLLLVCGCHGSPVM